MGAIAQGFAGYETPSVADAMRDASSAAASHAAKVKRTLRAVFSFFIGAATAVTRWLRQRCQIRLGRR